jgi:hypothetical protein
MTIGKRKFWKFHPQMVCLFSIALGLLIISCQPSLIQVTGIYSGVVTEPSASEADILLQLHSDGTFWQREIRSGLPIGLKVRTGHWILQGDLIVLTVPGEKDARFRWEHAFLRSESASSAHPDLPLDRVALQRIGQ